MKFCDKLNANVPFRTECKRTTTINSLFDEVQTPYSIITNKYKSNNIRTHCNPDHMENTQQTGGAIIDNKTIDNKTIDNKTIDNKTIDNKTIDNKTIDNKTIDNKTEETQYEYDELTGGASDIFKNSKTMYLLADATDTTTLNNIYSRIAKLKISPQLLKGVTPHISLMQIIINTSNKDHQILLMGKNINPHFQMSMSLQYNKISPQMYISSPKGGYEIMGDFFAKVYTASNSAYISLFRTNLYKYIEGFLGKGQRRSVVINNKKYFIYSYRGRDLLAVPDYYHGKGNWKPHLSIIKLDKIYKSNPQLYSQYLKNGKSSLISALSGVNGALSSFNLYKHFRRLRITAV
jgi:hypothetical protein